MQSFKEMTEILRGIWSFQILSFDSLDIKVYHVVGIILIFFLTRLVIKFTRRVLNREIQRRHLDAGRTLAIYQIAKYVIIIIAIAVGLEMLGFQLNILLAGSAALLVGVGLGLQQTFNDFISGIILLFEGTVLVGDIVEVGGIVGRVDRIDMRTSEICTRDNTIIIVPNSKLVNDNVINWSHNRKETRFNLRVGVAYGSDVQLVKKLLESAAQEHANVTAESPAEVRFIDFGDSALVFDVLFWTNNMFRIEQIKSDIRFAIDQKFRENGIVIPFPQRDVHLKGNDPKN